MKVYYVISRMGEKVHSIFKEIINSLENGKTVDYFLSDEYYNHIYKNHGEDIRAGCIYHELLFLSYIKEKYNISFTDINWIFNEELVIFNENLYIFKNSNWIHINNEKVYIFAVKLGYNNPFWFLIDKIPNVSMKFSNKPFKYRLRGDKLQDILDIYEKRKEYIGNFMLPLYSNKSIEMVNNILTLRNKLSGKDVVIVKGSYLSDNGKAIKLIKINDFISNNDSIDYLLSNIGWNRGSVYLTDRYDCKKEYRFYVNRNLLNQDINVFYLKHKVHITKKEELFGKKTIQTGVYLRVNWEDGDLGVLNKNFLDAINYVMSNIEQTSGALEFIEQNDGNIRFLEINDLGDSFVRKPSLEEPGKKRIYSILDNMFINFEK